MKLQNPQPLLDAAIKKALKPYADKLREFFDEVPRHNEQIARYSAQRAEEDWFSLHNRAAHGDKQAQEEIKSMPVPDYKAFRQKYGTLENMYWEAFQNWHKGFDQIIANAAKAILEEVEKHAPAAQKQLDEVHAELGEEISPSTWVRDECGRLRVLCSYIIDDRAEKDPNFLREYL